MKRWMLNILAGLSLAVFLGTVVLWARAPFFLDEGIYTWRFHGVHTAVVVGVAIQSRAGLLSIMPYAGHGALRPGQRWSSETNWGRYWRSYPTSAPAWSFAVPAGPRAFQFKCHTYWSTWSNGTVSDYYTRGVWLGAPYWFAALLSAILPVWRFGGWKRRRRRYRLAHGLCINCGYDLRATPVRCPECGTEILSQSKNS